jgi:hypothetical protein
VSCISIGSEICCVLYQHRRCDMLCCINFRGAIYGMLYQHWRCDMLCAVSAMEVRYAVCCISIGSATYFAVCQQSRCDRFFCLSILEVTFSCCMCNGNAACSGLCIGGDSCPVVGAVDAATSDVCVHNHSDYELPCSVITYRATSTYS